MELGGWRQLRVVDSHTEGEPTRTLLEGAPPLEGASMAERLEQLRREHDALRRLCVWDPRGSEALVGACVTEGVSPGASFGVIFFNTSGYLGMCGHATIGALVSLLHAGRLRPGRHLIDTPVGAVEATLDPDGSVTLINVPSFRQQAGVEVALAEPVAGVASVRGDVAWGGNWFLIVRPSPVAVEREQEPTLSALAWAIRRALREGGVRGWHGSESAEIDHIALIGESDSADARGFVLCPGGAVDRSPCGTGTSALLACLAADGALPPGRRWRQEGILGSAFEAHYRPAEGSAIVPTLRGRAWVTAESTLLLDPSDPFPEGYRLQGSSPPGNR